MKRTAELSPHTMRVFRFIQSYITKHNYAPTHREIAAAMGFKSFANGVRYHLRKLQAHKLIRVRRRKSRAIRVVT